MPEQYSRFKILLKTGIGNRTNTEFAKAADVSAEWISRTLNKEQIPRPSRNTLEKIASVMENGVTLAMLLESCDYTVEPNGSTSSGRSNLSIEERIVKNANDIDEGLKTVIGYKQFWSDIDEFFDHFVMLFSVEELACTIEKDRDYKGGYHRGAERSMLVSFRWENNSHIISTFAVIYYLRTTKGKFFFFGYSLEAAKIMDAGYVIPSDCKSVISDNGLAFTAVSEKKTILQSDNSLDEQKKVEKYKEEIKTLQDIVDRRNRVLPDDPCNIFIDKEKKELFESAIDGLRLLEKHQELGTLDEISNTLERQKPKKPIIKPWSPARCPACGKELSESMGDGYYKHHTFLERCTNPECAQRLDWEDIS